MLKLFVLSATLVGAIAWSAAYADNQRPGLRTEHPCCGTQPTRSGA
jgi:hypothetical protein